MKRLKRLIVTCAFAFLTTASCWAQAREASVAGDGLSTTKATLAGKSIQVNIYAMKAKRPDPGFPLALEGYDEVSVVRQIVVTIDGEAMWVPRSVYADLFNVRKASLKFEGHMFVLDLVGADASDLYSARVLFTSTTVMSRTVYSHSTGTRKVSEVTKYSQPEVIK